MLYEAAPGTFLHVGVSLAEHTAAAGGNYNPFLEGGDLWASDEEEEEDLADLEVFASELRARDRRRVWRTAEGREIPLSRLGKRHRVNICGFLLGRGLDPREVVPNLAALVAR